MSTLTDVRSDLAAQVASTLGVPVFDAWPRNVSAPCAIVTLGTGSQRKRAHWETGWRVTVVGPAGDNREASLWVEQAALDVARALSELYTTPVGWEAPTRVSVAGNDYLMVVVTLRRDIEGVA